jgi:hypothetical protein
MCKPVIGTKVEPLESAASGSDSEEVEEGERYYEFQLSIPDYVLPLIQYFVRWDTEKYWNLTGNPIRQRILNPSNYSLGALTFWDIEPDVEIAKLNPVDRRQHIRTVEILRVPSK